MIEQQDKLTTVQISVSVREMLRFLAERKRRSMAGQLEWLIQEAYQAETSPSPTPTEQQAAGQAA